MVVGDMKAARVGGSGWGSVGVWVWVWVWVGGGAPTLHGGTVHVFAQWAGRLTEDPSTGAQLMS